MSTDPNSLAGRVSSFYTRLSTVAHDLNAVSDELGKSVADIDAAIKKLNLGISVWVTIYSGQGDVQYRDTSYWSEDLGYSKVKGKWGICLRRVDGDYRDPDRESEEEWLFTDAPRTLRLASIDKIPELLEKLSAEAVETTKKLREKLADVNTVARTVNPEAAAMGGGSPKKRTLVQALMDSDVSVVGLTTTPAYGPLGTGVRSAVSKALGDLQVTKK